MLTPNVHMIIRHFRLQVIKGQIAFCEQAENYGTWSAAVCIWYDLLLLSSRKLALIPCV